MRTTRSLQSVGFFCLVIGTTYVASAFQTNPLAATPRNLGRTARDTSLSKPRPNFSPSKFSPSPTRLEANALAGLASPLGSVSVLAFVILVHECGHYLAAKLFGMKVEEFSVGLGPRLFGFQAFGDEFNLRAVPLGGYVRFPENYNTTEFREIETRAMEYEAKQESAMDRTLADIVTLGGYSRELKQIESDRLKEEEEAKKQLPFWKKLLKQEPEKKELEYIDPRTYEIKYYDDPDLLQNRAWPQRAVVIAGGVVFNILLAFTIYFGAITVGSGLPKPSFSEGVVVGSITSSSSPAANILQKGDVILGVNGSPLSETRPSSAMASQKAITDCIATIRATPDGDALKFSVIRAAKAQSDAPATPSEVTITPNRASKGAPQSIGVMLQPNFVKMEKIQTKNVAEATKVAAGTVSELTRDTVSGIVQLVQDSVSGKAGAAGAQVSGPIGLIRAGSEVVSTNDFITILTFAAAISVNLAVINALPLPALDGGQMVFILFEAVSGRKVDQRVQENIIGITFFFLLLLTLGTSLGDLEKLFAR